MDYKELLEKYNNLLIEVDRLSKENKKLKDQIGITEHDTSNIDHSLNDLCQHQQFDVEVIDKTFSTSINNKSDSADKIKLFMSLFKGRDDVYAKRWENEKKGTFGYSPVCLNLWKAGLCNKPKGSCTKCENKLYANLDMKVIENHLRGNIVVGIYPMLPDETCFF